MSIGKTISDAIAIVSTLIDIPRLLAAGVEAERQRTALYMECRALGLDVSKHETTDALAAKRDEAAGYAHYDQYDACIASVRIAYRHGDCDDLDAAIDELCTLKRPPNHAARGEGA